jgi:hypothetical protein
MFIHVIIIFLVIGQYIFYVTFNLVIVIACIIPEIKLAKIKT